MLTAQLMFHLEAEAQCHSVRMRDPQNKVVGPFWGKHINIGVIKFSLFPWLHALWYYIQSSVETRRMHMI